MQALIAKICHVLQILEVLPGLVESVCMTSRGVEVTAELGTCGTICNVGKDRIPGDSRRAWKLCPAVSCCISAVAFFRLNLLNRDDFRRILSSRRDLLRGFAKTLRRASLMACGSLRRPPVLMDVVSRAVARRVTASPPDIKICKTWV